MKKEAFKKLSFDEKMKLKYEAGKTDAEAGYPPKESSNEYLLGYAVGSRPDEPTTWDKPY